MESPASSGDTSTAPCVAFPFAPGRGSRGTTRMLPSPAHGDTSRWYERTMSGMTIGLVAVKAFDAKALSEAALILCGVGALGVWIGLRFDRYLFRWAGMTVI